MSQRFVKDLVSRVQKEIDKVNHELVHIRSELTKQANYWLKSLAVASAFFEFVEKSESDEQFKGKE